jgi:hypothetical protein
MANRTRDTANLVSDNNLYVDIGTDRVGIGTTNPTSKLTVVGTSLITGISTIGNLIITPVGTGATVGGVGVVTYYGDGGNLTNVEDYFVIAASDETTNLGIGSGKVSFRMPYAATLLAVRASVNTVSTGSTPAIIVDINKNVGFGTTSVLGTKLSIDPSENTSTTAATAATITDSALADDAEITIDIDQVGATTPGKGLKVYLKTRRN